MDQEHRPELSGVPQFEHREDAHSAGDEPRGGTKNTDPTIIRIAGSGRPQRG